MRFITNNVMMLCLGLNTSVLIANEAQQRLSYAIGVEVTKPVLREQIAIDTDSFLAGAHDSLVGELKMSEEEIKTEITAFMEQMMQKKEKEMKLVDESNKKEGEEFLAQHKKEKGVVTLPSGIQYKVLASSGNKQHPAATDTVTTHYKGTLINGTKFDSSYDRGEPLNFALNQVIPGWTEVLQLMSPGDKWEVVIPSHLAYGQYAASPLIGPNKTLIFDIELLEYHSTKN